MAIDGIAKNQHYVPQFILKNFSNGKKDQVCVFDKKVGGNFKSNVKNIASENGFYNFKVDNEDYSLEPLLCNIETSSAKIIKQIVVSESLDKLTKEDKKILSHFIAIQFVRTKDYREHFKDIFIKIRDNLSIRGFTDDIMNHSGVVEPSDIEVKEYSLKAIKDASSIVPYFYDKDWTIQKTSSEAKFYISDHPIAMKNFYKESEFSNNIGLNVEGIEVYFPISPSLTIGMYCPTLLQSFKSELLNAKAQLVLSPNSDFPTEPISNMEKLICCFETGEPMSLIKENVIHLNSLQVINGNRFIYSSNNDFELVENMLAKNDAFRSGNRVVVK